MGRTVALREDFDGPGLRRLAKASKDAGQSRRLLALAEIYDGGKRGDAARIGDVGLQVIRDWVLRFNARGPEGLIDGKSTGRPPSSTTGNAKRLHGSSRRARSRRSMAWCAGAGRICRFGYSRSLASPLRNRASAENCGRWASPRSPRGRATKDRTNSPLRILKKLRGQAGPYPERAPGQHRYRNLVAR